MEPKESKDRIIVALDVPTASVAISLIKQLAPHVGGFKVGLELITSGQHVVVEQAVVFSDKLLFHDGKLHDIPNTVGAAVREATQLGAHMINVHISAGRAALRAAVENKGNAKILGVTVLTSLKTADLVRMFKYRFEDINLVLDLACIAAEEGLDGVICSPQEVATLRELPQTKDLMLVTPGVRPEWAAKGDQQRVMTPAEAIRAGADYLVIGRPITKPPAEIDSPVEAAKRIAAEIATAQ